MESMRLFPPAAILKRKAIQKCEIGGYGVPKGTSIMLPICVVQRDPRFFDGPDCFRPARWTEGLQSACRDSPISRLAAARASASASPWQ